jgi:hypothetical protein
MVVRVQGGTLFYVVFHVFKNAGWHLTLWAGSHHTVFYTHCDIFFYVWGTIFHGWKLAPYYACRVHVICVQAAGVALKE